MSEWELNGGSSQKSPQQDNCSDCGVFACTTARYILRGLGLTFAGQDMSYIRRAITVEILDQRLSA